MLPKIAQKIMDRDRIAQKSSRILENSGIFSGKLPKLAKKNVQNSTEKAPKF